MRLPISTRLAIERTDARLSARVRQIRELDDLKRELNRTIKRLGVALTTSGAKWDEDLVYVPGGLGQPHSPGSASPLSVEQQHKLERTWMRVREMATELDREASIAVAERMRQVGLVRRCEVEAELERLHRRMTALAKASASLVGQLGNEVQPALVGQPMPA